MAAGTSTLLAGAAILGTGVSIYGQYKANKAQAAAEEVNAAFYEEQAKFAEESLQRELAIYQEQAEEFKGSQISGYARGGVDMSGSPLLVLATTKARQEAEKEAMIANSKMQQREAYLKAGASYEQASRLTSFSNNALPAVGAALNTGVQIASLTRSSTSNAPTTPTSIAPRPR
jgi:hypothetical protein